MKVFINPGHDIKYDSGAVHYDADGNVDLRECDVAAKIGTAVQKYLEAAGCLIIAWSENIEAVLPQDCIRVTISKTENSNERIIEITGAEID